MMVQFPPPRPVLVAQALPPPVVAAPAPVTHPGVSTPTALTVPPSLGMPPAAAGGGLQPLDVEALKPLGLFYESPGSIPRSVVEQALSNPEAVVVFLYKEPGAPQIPANVAGVLVTNEEAIGLQREGWRGLLGSFGLNHPAVADSRGVAHPQLGVWTGNKAARYLQELLNSQPPEPAQAGLELATQALRPSASSTPVSETTPLSPNGYTGSDYPALALQVARDLSKQLTHALQQPFPGVNVSAAVDRGQTPEQENATVREADDPYQLPYTLEVTGYLPNGTPVTMEVPVSIRGPLTQLHQLLGNPETAAQFQQLLQHYESSGFALRYSGQEESAAQELAKEIGALTAPPTHTNTPPDYDQTNAPLRTDQTTQQNPGGVGFDAPGLTPNPGDASQPIQASGAEQPEEVGAGESIVPDDWNDSLTPDEQKIMEQLNNTGASLAQGAETARVVDNNGTRFAQMGQIQLDISQATVGQQPNTTRMRLIPSGQTEPIIADVSDETGRITSVQFGNNGPTTQNPQVLERAEQVFMQAITPLYESSLKSNLGGLGGANEYFYNRYNSRAQETIDTIITNGSRTGTLPNPGIEGEVFYLQDPNQENMLAVVNTTDNSQAPVEVTINDVPAKAEENNGTKTSYYPFQPGDTVTYRVSGSDIVHQFTVPSGAAEPYNPGYEKGYSPSTSLPPTDIPVNSPNGYTEAISDLEEYLTEDMQDGRLADGTALTIQRNADGQITGAQYTTPEGNNSFSLTGEHAPAGEVAQEQQFILQNGQFYSVNEDGSSSNEPVSLEQVLAPANPAPSAPVTETGPVIDRSTLSAADLQVLEMIENYRANAVTPRGHGDDYSNSQEWLGSNGIYHGVFHQQYDSKGLPPIKELIDAIEKGDISYLDNVYMFSYRSGDTTLRLSVGNELVVDNNVFITTGVTHSVAAQSNNPALMIEALRFFYDLAERSDAARRSTNQP